MLDARGVYRKVTRKIFDFSSEQLANLTSIVWLYRGQSERFVALVEQYLDNAVLEANLALKPTEDFVNALEEACEEIALFFNGKDFDAFGELDKTVSVLREDASKFEKAIGQTKKMWAASKRDNEAMKASARAIGDLAEHGHDLARQSYQLRKHAISQPRVTAGYKNCPAAPPRRARTGRLLASRSVAQSHTGHFYRSVNEMSVPTKS